MATQKFWRDRKHLFWFFIVIFISTILLKIIPDAIFVLLGLYSWLGLYSLLGLLSRLLSKPKKIESSWQPLAASRHLTFVPASFFRPEPYITGTYRHHLLKLEIHPGGKNYSTSICLLVSENTLAQGFPQNEPHLPDDRVVRKDAIGLLTPTSPHYILKGSQLKGSVTVRTVDQTVHVGYKQLGIEDDLEYLGYLFDLLSDLAEAYPAVVALGGEAVPFLKDEIANDHHVSIATELLKAIARDTTARIGDRASQAVCPSCLTRYKAHKVWPGVFVNLLPITYYGCRICGQSREFLEGCVV
ncbi:MAG: hypothetical protein GY801_18155, partial [bacterium]|nr:hypothetical protein [bacterium]